MDLSEKGLSGGGDGKPGWAEWSQLVRNIEPTAEVGKDAVEEGLSNIMKCI